jgi:hypothetical protein
MERLLSSNSSHLASFKRGGAWKAAASYKYFAMA